MFISPQHDRLANASPAPRGRLAEARPTLTHINTLLTESNLETCVEVKEDGKVGMCGVTEGL